MARRGGGRFPATPCRHGSSESADPQDGALVAVKPHGVCHSGPEGRMYLVVRESIMPMLTLTEADTPIKFRPFKCPTG